jgi:hypothetical protein
MPDNVHQTKMFSFAVDVADEAPSASATPAPAKHFLFKYCRLPEEFLTFDVVFSYETSFKSLAYFNVRQFAIMRLFFKTLSFDLFIKPRFSHEFP